jgi:hypothetical protein
MRSATCDQGEKEIFIGWYPQMPWANAEWGAFFYLPSNCNLGASGGHDAFVNIQYVMQWRSSAGYRGAIGEDVSREAIETFRQSTQGATLALFVAWMACGLIVVAASALPPQSPLDTQFGNFLFSVPNGWKVTEKDNAMYIVAPELRSGTATYIALTANDLDGDLQKSADALWGGFRNSYRILQGGQIRPFHSSKGYDAYSTTAVALDRSGTRWNVYFMGAQHGKRIETVMFLSSLPPGVSYDAVLRTFQTFLGDLSFGDSLPRSNIPPVNDPLPALETGRPLPAGMLQGVYVCLSSGIQTANKQYIFYPDGYMMYGLPQEGMLDFDFDHYRSQDNKDRNWFGRYRVDGDQVKIVWQNQFGDPAHPAVIKINTTAFPPPVDFGWEIFIPMCRCTGKKFSGTYRWGAPAADQYIQFSSDGTFVDHRVLDQMLIPSPFYEHPRIQRGTYSIQSQTIIFNFADGHRGARTFLAPKVQESNPMLDWIELGIHQLFEETYRQRLAANP